MSVDRETTLRMAKAAQLRIAPEEAGPVTDALNGILDFCAHLGDLDTSGTPDFTWTMKTRPGRRADAAETWPDREAFQAAAPTIDGDFFRVPRILAEE